MPDARGTPTRQRILQVASELFADRGFHATTTREIALAVGIRQPGLFHHFSSKAEIMAELQRMDFSASSRASQVAESLDVSPATALGVSIALDAQRLLDGPYAAASTTQPSVMNDPAFAEGRALYEHAVALEADLINRAVVAGDFVTVDPGVAVTALEWMIDGVVQDAWRKGEDTNAEATVALLLQFSLRALIADPANLQTVLDEIDSTVAGLDPISWDMHN